MRRILLCALLAASCAHAPRPAPPATVTISIIGTNDLHGHFLPRADGKGGLALLAGYLANLRHARAADGGVLLVDAGDLFQGTMDSNLNEGAAVVGAYNLLGYDAAAIGNHEFDFGPVGPRTLPGPGDDARGALRAAAARARFPFLTANVIDSATGKPLAGPNIAPSVMREVAGVRIGIIGVTTAGTPFSTAKPLFAGLELAPLAPVIDAEARRLRAAGAQLIVIAAHAGLCKQVDDSDELQTCDIGEIVDVLKAVHEPVDVVLAGHTHAGAIYKLDGTPISEAWKYGTGFGRIDVVYDRVRQTKVSVDLRTPQVLVPGDYEGAPVVPDPRIARALAPYVEAAAAKSNEKLGVRVVATVDKSYDHESALGNLAADLMMLARPGSDLALVNGGGLRNELPVGELTYGVFYQAFPFDNTFATVRLTGAELRKLFERNLTTDRGILSISGMRVVARCDGKRVDVQLLRGNGQPVRDDEMVTALTSDFLASGSMEGALKLEPGRVTLDLGDTIRDASVAVLPRRGAALDGRDPALLDPAHPRLQYPGTRPVTCP